MHWVVLDTGAGLDANARAHLFEPYAGAGLTVPGAVPQGSTGLGLMVSRQIAERMGGHIELKSAAGQGTVATFVLPRGVTTPTTPQAAGEARAQTGAATEIACNTGRIVVCDDDPVSRMLTAQMLRLHGWQADEAANATHALALCASTPASALITDLNMPGLDGAGLIERLRQAELGRARQTRVIICSGSDIEANAGDLDADARLRKPLEMQALVQTLLQLGLVAPGPAATNATNATQAA